LIASLVTSYNGRPAFAAAALRLSRIFFDTRKLASRVSSFFAMWAGLLFRFGDVLDRHGKSGGAVYVKMLQKTNCYIAQFVLPPGAATLALPQLWRACQYPRIHPFCACAQQGARALAQGCAGGHHVVHDSRMRGQHAIGDGECTA